MIRQLSAQPYSGIALLLLAFILRIVFLGQESLWNDEALTLGDALKPLNVIVGQRWDPHPPLYYLLMHFWMELGRSETIVRFPSVLFGTISVPAIFLLGRRLFSRQVGWLAALLLAVAPLAVWYSQEARMYALVALWGLLSTWLWAGLLTAEKSRWSWPAYILVTTLGLYTHYTMGLVVIGQNLMAAALLAGHYPALKLKWSTWLLGQFALLVLYLPWLPNLPAHWQLIRESTDYPFWVLSTPPALAGIALAGIGLWAGLLLWVRRPPHISPQQRQKLLYLALAVIGSLFLAFLAISLTNRLTTLKRQTFVLFPFLCLALAYLLAQLPRRKIWAALLVALCLAGVLVNGLTLQKPPWREVVAHIETSLEPGDGVVLSPYWINSAFRYYNGTIPIIRLDPEQLERQSAAMTTTYDRIWLIRNSKFEVWTEPEAQIPTWFQTNYTLETTFQAGELIVALFRLEPD